MANVAFLGLGVMGAPMAGHLVRAGHSVTVYNRTAAKARGLGGPPWRGHGPDPGAGGKRRRFRHGLPGQ